MRKSPVTSTRVERVTHERRESTHDLVAVEEPLQVLLDHGAEHERRETPLAVTMRTPGDDIDLVAGFLFGEGVIGSTNDLIDVRHCEQSDTPHNVVRARLRQHVVVPPHLLARSLTMTSACGVCGERTLDALDKAGCAQLSVEPNSLHPRSIRLALASLERSQAFFRNTGGTHGAALFDREGQLLIHREDVGRHNALDKLIGANLRSPPPVVDAFVVVSSRASFELVQKTVRAGCSALVSIGAASTMAIDTARHFRLTLIGFAREDRFNLYSEPGRVAHEEAEGAFIDLGAE